MSIALLAIEVRHERRIRCVFSAPLAAGAFSTTHYVITSLNDIGAAPTVSAAMMSTTSDATVDLILSIPLAKGGLYQISAVGVPAADATVTPAESVEQFRYGVLGSKENVEPTKRNKDRLLYGVDLVWNGVDFQETATGDLDSIGGTPNVNKALRRRVESPGLPWNPDYGVKAREFVDSPATTAGTLRGRITSQLLQDPRVKEVTVTVDFNDRDEVYLHASPKLISGEAIQPVSVEVPSDG